MIESIWNEARWLATQSIWHLRIGVIMPDHLHLLVEISPTFSLVPAVRLFKGRLSPLLRAAGLSWQPAYFDHRMRTEEDRLPVFQYILLNPVRGGLVAHGAAWRGFYCDAGDWAWFCPLAASEHPLPDWLD